MLGCVEAVTGGIECAFGRLHRGQGVGERVLRRGQPAVQVGQLPDSLARRRAPSASNDDRKPPAPTTVDGAMM